MKPAAAGNASGAFWILSGYELGRQPLTVASALAFLERAGHAPRALDLAVEGIDRLLDRDAGADDVRLVAISVPMHTALRIGVRAARRIRERLRRVHICFFGLYAVLNASYLLESWADSVIGGEVEEPLVGLADALARGAPLESVAGLELPGRPARPHLARLDFPVPSRGQLPDLERYARLVIGKEERLAAAVEGSRGCLHRCRHCPIPPVYGGRFFVVPRRIVLQDIRALAARGVRHVTFADPDFLNGPGHSMALVRELHDELPELTFDVTTKIEHLLRYRRHLPELAAAGCLFVVSAVESLSDVVLGHLEKGHTRSDVFEAQRLLRAAGITLRPSLLPFTPWATLEDYFELLDWIDGDRLAGSVDPVQLSIRLLVPPGSLLAESSAFLPYRGRLDRSAFTYEWRHPDARMDRLQHTIGHLVAEAARSEEDAALTFSRIRRAADAAIGHPERPRPAWLAAAVEAPRLSEPWFC